MKTLLATTLAALLLLGCAEEKEPLPPQQQLTLLLQNYTEASNRQQQSAALRGIGTLAAEIGDEKVTQMLRSVEGSLKPAAREVLTRSGKPATIQATPASEPTPAPSTGSLRDQLRLRLLDLASANDPAARNEAILAITKLELEYGKEDLLRHLHHEVDYETPLAAPAKVILDRYQP